MSKFNRILAVVGAGALCIALVSTDSMAQGRRGGAGAGPGAGRGPQAAVTAGGMLAGVDLTPEQQRQINAIRQETQQKVQAIQRDTRLTQAQKQAQTAAAQDAGHNRVMNLLTAQQRQQVQTQTRVGAQGNGLGMGPCGQGLGQGRQGKAGTGQGLGMGPCGAGQGPGGQGQGQRGAGYGRNGEVPGVQLTTQQQQRIQAIRAEMQQVMQRLQQDPNLTPEQKAYEREQLQKETHERVMQELTDQQRQQFQKFWDERGVPGAGAGAGAKAGRGGR